MFAPPSAVANKGGGGLNKEGGAKYTDINCWVQSSDSQLMELPYELMGSDSQVMTKRALLRWSVGNRRVCGTLSRICCEFLVMLLLHLQDTLDFCCNAGI